MRIPRKIDDRLTDAIVNIQFNPGVPADAVIGYFHSLTRDLYDITSGDSDSAFSPFNAPGFLIEQRSFFAINSELGVRIDVSERQINFNITSGYIGWDRYSKLIEQTLQLLFDHKIIRKINRLGLRYVSDFANTRLFQHIGATLQLHVLNPSMEKSQFRTEFTTANGFYAILSLSNAYPTFVEQTGQPDGAMSSRVDIDVIRVYLPQDAVSFAQLVSQIQQMHDEQKQLFFSLLTDEFVQTLNPQY